MAQTNPIVRLSEAETKAWRAGGAGRAKLVRLFTRGAKKLGRTIVVDSRARYVHTFTANPPKKTAPRAGQRQLFPESLQHSRQLTMGSMMPVETARVEQAERARVARALRAQATLLETKNGPCLCANPKRKTRPKARKKNPPRNIVAKLELSRHETAKWGNASYRLAVIRKGKALAKRLRGAVQVVDAHHKVRSTLTAG